MIKQTQEQINLWLEFIRVVRVEVILDKAYDMLATADIPGDSCLWQALNDAQQEQYKAFAAVMETEGLVGRIPGWRSEDLTG